MKIQFPLKDLKSISNRLIAASFLILVLFALFIYYSENYETQAQYPSTRTVLSDYPEGKMISVDGDVIAVYEGGFYLEDDYKGESVTYNVSSSSKVEMYDKVSVLGKLGPSYTVKVSKILVHKKWKEDFILYRSGIGGLFLAVIFFIYWKFDFKNLEFIRRKEK
ncbi:MAG: hypothetical protein QMD61_11455 [Methanobacterium sp.]|nr:hypothetical protein [Methanobacterium sp.]